MTIAEIKTSLLENPICVFAFSSPQNLHGSCLSNHCVRAGGEVCLTQRMRRHLLSKNSLIKDPVVKSKFSKYGVDLDEFENDWGLLNLSLQQKSNAHSDIVKEFRKTENYRLRFKQHAELGEGLIRGVIQSLEHSFKRSFSTVWGQDYATEIYHHEKVFQLLLNKSRSETVGGIYRLFDLTMGGDFDGDTLPRLYCLCFLFAFSHGAPDSSLFGPPKSIDEFVARFEFFREFASRFEKELRKSSGGLDLEYRLLETLVSAEIGQIAYNMWKGHLLAAENTKNARLLDCKKLLETMESHFSQGREPPQPLLLDAKRQLVAPCKNVQFPRLRLPYEYTFESELAKKLQRQSGVLEFKSTFSAAYHPFKHGDVAALFNITSSRAPRMEELRSWTTVDFANYATTAMENYMAVIQATIEQSNEPSTRPSQFDNGTIFTFKCAKQGAGRKATTTVIVSAYENGIQYCLTGY